MQHFWIRLETNRSESNPLIRANPWIFIRFQIRYIRFEANMRGHPSRTVCLKGESPVQCLQVSVSRPLTVDPGEGGCFLQASTRRLEERVSLRVGELEIEVSLTMDTAPLWVSPTHLSVSPPICLSVWLSLRLSVCMSAYLSVCPPACLSVSLPVCLSVCLPVRLPACGFVCPSVYPPAWLPVRYLPAYRFACLPVCLPAWDNQWLLDQQACPFINITNTRFRNCGCGPIFFLQVAEWWLRT